MESFNQILAGSNIVIGTAVSDWTNSLEHFPNPPHVRHYIEGLDRQAAFERTLVENFSCVVAENAMKPAYTQERRGEVKWNSEAEHLMRIAKDRLQLKGHTLAWHTQMPTWFQDWEGNSTLTPEEKRDAIRDHVSRVAALMNDAGVVIIDVLNECIHDDKIDGEPKKTLRRFWTSNLGYEYDQAVKYLAGLFKIARERAPNARLCINDYLTTTGNEKSDALYDLCVAIRNEGGPVEEVGFQTHQFHWEINDTFLTSMKENFARFKRIGMTCNISELDLGFGDKGHPGNDHLSADDAARIAAEAAAPAWYNFFKAALEDRSVCRHITLWGFDTRVSWRVNPKVFGENVDRNPCCPWRTDSSGILRQTAIVGEIRRALREVVGAPPPVRWQPFGCDVSSGFLTQNRSGGTFSGPQLHLSADTTYTLRTRIAGAAARDVFLTLKSSHVDGDPWEFVRLWDEKTANVDVTFRTTRKPFNVIYLEGPPVGVDFVVGPTILNGAPINWESTFPPNGSLRELTYASDRQGRFAGLSVAPPPGNMWTLSTRVYSGQPLKLTMQFWDFEKGDFGFKTLAQADSAGGISANFAIPAPAPNGTRAHVYIESESDRDGVQDYAAEAPTLWTLLSPL